VILMERGVRRVLGAVLAAAMLGCGSVKDMFTAHPDVAAEAGGQQLRVERLANLMTRIKGMPLNTDAAGFLAGLWVDYTLFSQALVNGTDLSDSTLIAEVLWPQIAEIRGSRWHDTLMAHQGRHENPDSLYAGDRVRLFQHILFRVDRAADPNTKEAARKKAEATLGRIRRGADFGRLASELSEDPVSRRDKGYNPPAPRGRYVASFDSAAWALAPGQVSDVVETSYGFHIIRRPPLAEVRDRFAAYGEQQAGMRLDSLYLDSLSRQKHLRISDEAPELMREAIEDQDASRRSDKAIATFDGGRLTVGQFVRWLNALGPQFAMQLTEAKDSSLTQFARIIGQNVLLLHEADSAGISVSPEEWQQLASKHRESVDTMRAALGLWDSEFTDSAASPEERNRVAALKLDQFLDQVANGKLRPRPLPAPLSGMLRDRGSYRVYPAGLDRAVEIAKEVRQAQADSAAQQNPDSAGRQGVSRK